MQLIAKTTNFETAVYDALRAVPKGKVTTYREIARAIGNPKAVRAVGNALHKNPNAPQVPCHRVVYSDGKIGNYAKGTPEKIRLLQQEGVKVDGIKVLNFSNIFHRFETTY